MTCNYHDSIVRDDSDLSIRKYDAIVKSGIPILKRYDIPGMYSLSSDTDCTDFDIRSSDSS